MSLLFLEHPSSLQHDTGPHPEQPRRIEAILRALDRRGWEGVERRRSEPAARDALEAVHPAAHIEAIEALSAGGGGAIDMDTVTSAGSYLAALHGAGGAVELVDRLLAGDFASGFSAHRPPGHHATQDRAMGFCLFNNVAVAAQHAIGRRACERVFILDWDVHHGNGTNDIFHASDQVLFVSIHQSPLYPGTGPASDVGSGAGTGFTVNLPVRPGSGDAVFTSLVDHVAVPLAEAFAPGLVLVSAGYDAHREDPLGNCAVSDAGFAAMTASVRRLAERLGVPVGCVLEGGYGLDALARSVLATVETLAAEQLPVTASIGLAPEAAEARTRLSGWWPTLSPSVE